MANSTKKPTSSKKSTQGNNKPTSKKSPERDEYAYYDDLYEKKPKKKKKIEEEEDDRDDYAYYDDLYKKKEKKKPRHPEHDEEEIKEELPPASTQVLHRLMPWLLGVITVFIVACFLLATVDGAMGDLGVILRNMFFGFFGWPAYFIPLVLVNLIIYWRRYVDLGVLRSKLIFGGSIPVLLSALIHSLAIAALYKGGYKWAEWVNSIFGFGKDVPWTARRPKSFLEISPGCSLEGLMLTLKLLRNLPTQGKFLVSQSFQLLAGQVLAAKSTTVTQQMNKFKLALGTRGCWSQREKVFI